MTEFLTAAQMRAREQIAMRERGVSGADLMEQAGRGVVDAMLSKWPEMSENPRAALILCGPGNNGGDGYVIARLLSERGWLVRIETFGDHEWLAGDAALNRDRFDRLEASSFDGAPDVVIDAVFGTGLSRDLDERAQRFLQRFEGGNARKVAVDIPSGLSSDTGQALGYALTADLTVTFHRAKCGHVLADGPSVCGDLVVVPLSLRGPFSDDPLRSVAPLDAAQLAKPVAGHKFSNGAAVVFSGGFAQTGAARLTARAALRVGAGLVTLAAPRAAMPEIAAQISSLMVREAETISDIQAILGDDRVRAICIGPGFGVERAIEVLPAVFAANRPIVLDADALTALSRAPDLMSALGSNCVLTPHAGEFARLFPDLATQPKVEATIEAARRTGAHVVFKGHDTVIAAPDGTVRIAPACYERAAPWLATAGSGDVLAGIITGLMARGMAPMEAACIGVALHIECGRVCAAGLIAEDLPDAIPQVFRALGV